MSQASRNGRSISVISGLLLLTLLSLFGYLIGRTYFVITSAKSLLDLISAVCLLAAESFIVVHGFGYFLNLLQVTRNPQGTCVQPESELHSSEFPPVAVVVASYKEPLDVLEDTLTCLANLTYPNKRLYLLDDTRYDQTGASEELAKYRDDVTRLAHFCSASVFRRQWRGAKAGIINDFLAMLGGTSSSWFELAAAPGATQHNDAQYLIVFDADMNPFPDFVEPLVSTLEADANLAFVQTPQYYTNFESNRVARASGLQQAVFYEYICEGKSLKNAMFCCGTNVMFRIAALQDVGGFREDSVTEDFATSFLFHQRGWSSRYLNRASAFGLGPQDLGAFYKQQFRWALGTVGLLLPVIARLLSQPRSLPLHAWWEYLLSTTHYFVGWAFLVMALCPALFLLFDLPTYYAYPEFYLLFYAPYAILTLLLFFWTLHQRSYSFRSVLIGVILLPVTFPVYIKATTCALLGVKGSFQVTPKEGRTNLPLRDLWPQVGLASVCFSAAIFGALRLYYETESLWAVAVNTFWCLYFTLVLSSVIYFNFPDEEIENG